MIDNKTLIVCGLVIALVIGILAVFFASGDPDGLESTALVVQGQKDLAGSAPPGAAINTNTEGKYTYNPPMPDYSPGAGSGAGGSILAMVGGTLLAFLVAIGLIFALKVVHKKNPPKANQ